jgi:hypothetical protein
MPEPPVFDEDAPVIEDAPSEPFPGNEPPEEI